MTPSDYRMVESGTINAQDQHYYTIFENSWFSRYVVETKNDGVSHTRETNLLERLWNAVSTFFLELTTPQTPCKKAWEEAKRAFLCRLSVYSENPLPSGHFCLEWWPK